MGYLPTTTVYSAPYDLVDGHSHTFSLYFPAGSWLPGPSLQISGVGFPSTVGGTVPIVQMHWLSGPYYVANSYNGISNSNVSLGLFFTVSTPNHTQSAGNSSFLQIAGGYGGSLLLDNAFTPDLIAGCQVTIVATIPPAQINPGNLIVATSLTASLLMAGALAQPPPVFGCTDPAATNYDPHAVVNDRSCLYPAAGGGGGGSGGSGGGPAPGPPILGCTDPRAINYNPAATQGNNTCIYPAFPILGCMDPKAKNYNAAATVSDDSCRYYGPGDLPPTLISTWTPADGSLANGGLSCGWSPGDPVPACTWTDLTGKPCSS